MMRIPDPEDYIDIHTHSVSDNSFCLRNIFAQELSDGLPAEGPFSIGLHPWHIPEVNVESCLELTEKYIAFPQVLAIGETGLDRNKDVIFEAQEKVFIQQLAISEKSLKPVVIHCVKAYSDILHIRKSKAWKMKWMFHWFNENLAIADELILSGCYLSFGRSLVHPNGKNAEVFRKVALDKIFLETDDAEISIESVYAKAAELKEISIAALKRAIYDNYRNVFLNF